MAEPAARASLVVEVERNSGEEDEALDQLLPFGPDTANGHAVVEHADDETTDDRAGNGADAARDGSPADEDGGDGVRFEAGYGARRGQVEPAGEKQARPERL